MSNYPQYDRVPVGEELPKGMGEYDTDKGRLFFNKPNWYYDGCLQTGGEEPKYWFRPTGKTEEEAHELAQEDAWLDGWNNGIAHERGENRSDFSDYRREYLKQQGR